MKFLGHMRKSRLKNVTFIGHIQRGLFFYPCTPLHRMWQGQSLKWHLVFVQKLLTHLLALPLFRETHSPFWHFPFLDFSRKILEFLMKIISCSCAVVFCDHSSLQLPVFLLWAVLLFYNLSLVCFCIPLHKLFTVLLTVFFCS